MVRFIINKTTTNHQSEFYIYIPIWLDLLYMKLDTNGNYIPDLHSNMVRFIIKNTNI